MPYQPLPVHRAEQLAAMSRREYRSYEVRVRRAAKRQGLILVKSRRRDPQAFDYGLYALANDFVPGAGGSLPEFISDRGTDLAGIAAQLTAGGAK